jgi:hypothetical protein
MSDVTMYAQLFAGTATPDSWMQHARGVTKLIQARGPTAHIEAWDGAMLLSFRPIIVCYTPSHIFSPHRRLIALQIMNALFSGEDCFLAKEQWQTVMRHNPVMPTRTISGTIMDPENLDAGDRYFQLLALLPALLRRGYALRAANIRGEHVDPRRVIRLADAAQQVHVKFSEWHPQLLRMEPFPKEVASQDPISIFPFVFRYQRSPWLGSLHSKSYLDPSFSHLFYPLNICSCR